MLRPLVCLAIMLVTAPAHGQSRDAAAEAAAEARLGFEAGAREDGMPRGWGGGGDGYELALDTMAPHAGKSCGRVRFTGSGTGGFGSMTTSEDIRKYRGKRVRLTGWLKTENVKSGWAGMWMRVDGRKPGEVLSFDNMADRQVKGSTPWTRYAIELDVPASAAGITLGFLVTGDGTVWGDDFSLEVTGPSRVKGEAPVPATVRKAEKSVAPEAVLHEIKRRAIPLKTDRAGQGFEDLDPLRKVVGDARIVSLGECSHGTAEVFRMKHRLLEFLVEKMGFTVFAIEGNWPESLAADRYVKAGEGSAAEALAAMYFWTWQTEEVRDMLDWMRAYNARPGVTKKLTFSSFDMQYPGVAADRVRKFAERMDAADRETIKKAYAWTSKLPTASDGTPPARRKAIADQVFAVEALLDKKRSTFPVGDAEFKEVRQCAHVVTQFLKMTWPNSANGQYDTRDRCMAENVGWLAEQMHPGEKIVLWAHNGHVSKAKYGGPGGPMGSYLKERYGPKMVVVGFATDHGSIRALRMNSTGITGGVTTLPLPPATKESVEAAFRECGMDRFALDLRSASPSTALGRWLNEGHPHRMPGAAYDPEADSLYVWTSLPAMYDVIVFLRQSTAAKPINFK